METAVDVKQYRPALYRHGGGVAEAKKLPPAAVYLECLRNHAASAGGHVVDGCGEFMPAPAASLGCAACGCHRSFHRRVAIPSGPPPPPAPRLALLPPPSTVAKAAPPRLGEEDRAAGAWEDDETDDESDYGDGRPMSPLPAPAFSPPPAAHLAPAPRHVLLSDLNTVAPASIPTPTAASPVSSSWSPPPPTPTAAPLGQGGTVPGALLAAARRRFRTKFSPEQKRRMRELSERLGWRLRRRDEATVESCCREIGVARCVFKVWMHNNKHNFVAGGGVRTARRNASASASPPVVQLQPSSFHTTAAAADASASPPPPVIHADFNINGPAADFSINVRAADYYVLQPVTASGGAPQSS